MSDYGLTSHGLISSTIISTNGSNKLKLVAGKYRSGEEIFFSRKAPSAEIVLTKTVAKLMPRALASSAAVTAASLHGESLGPPLASQPGARSVANSPNVVGAPSVRSTIDFSSAVESFSVSVQFRMACSVGTAPASAPPWAHQSVHRTESHG